MESTEASSTAATSAWLQEYDFGVGTWSWGDRLFWNYGKGYGEKELKEAFDASIEGGVRLFDTAEIYGQGQSEKLLGKFIQDSPEASPAIRVATKFMPYPWRLSRGSLLKALRGSLKRLGMARVDLYQVHQALPPVTPETWMQAMAEAVHAGLTSAVGVSNYSRDWTQRSYETLIREGIVLASNQVEYHLLNRTIEKNGLLKQCDELGVRLIAYSPLAMGVLTGKYTPENPVRGLRGSRYNKNFLAKIVPLIQLMTRLGAAHDGKTNAQIAINWCICKGTLPIPGAKTVSQAEQNTGALGWRLSTDEIEALDEMSDRVLGFSGANNN